MATTAKLRRSWPEFITRWPTATAEPRCDFSPAVGVVFPAGGPAYPAGFIILRVHPAARQAFRTLAAVMLHFGYQFREPAGGTLSCRRITAGAGTTLHAHGIADDHNPSKNRYRHRVGVIQWGRDTDMPRAMVGAIEAIKLTNGLHPWEWGGRWWNIKDPMHYQLEVLQTRMAPVNLATLPTHSWTQYLGFETRYQKGTDVELIKRLQTMLNKAGARDYQGKVLVVDGLWGTRTESAFIAGLKLGTGGTVDAAARKTANDALAAANRANGMLTKIHAALS